MRRMIKTRNDSHKAILSGGIDSSAITAIAASQMKNLHTFSIDYEDNLKYFKKTDFTVSQDNDFIKFRPPGKIL